VPRGDELSERGWYKLLGVGRVDAHVNGGLGDGRTGEVADRSANQPPDGAPDDCPYACKWSADSGTNRGALNDAHAWHHRTDRRTTGRTDRGIFRHSRILCARAQSRRTRKG
jgi:hypothetical protein